MSAYLVIAAAGLAGMGFVVWVTRATAHHPRHGGRADEQASARPPIAPPYAAPFAGSMSLADDPHASQRPAGLATWFPHPDPWGVPPAGEWTDDLLAELREAPTVLDHLECACGAEGPGQLGAVVMPDIPMPAEPGTLAPVLPVFPVPWSQVASLAGPVALLAVLAAARPVLAATNAEPLELPDDADVARLALAADAAAFTRQLDTDTQLYLLDLRDWCRTYLLDLREGL